MFSDKTSSVREILLVSRRANFALLRSGFYVMDLKTKLKSESKDSVTLKKLLSQELLIETSDGIKLTPLYDEMKLRASVTDKIEDKNVPVNDTVNVQVNDTIKILQLTERQRKIYEAIKTGAINVPNNVQVNVQVNIPNLAALFNVSEKTIRRDLYVLRDLNLIQYVGSDKTGHWEVTD